ncbi:MAG: hypothetical protein N3A61_09485 [Ignavibacteria bacterium]|nr:hypothetical protein [Ignavibacteria bacterium]
MTSPSSFNLNSPTANATVSKSSGLQVSWSGTSASDSVMIVLTPTSNPNNLIIKTGIANSGSYTFSASELFAISGQTMVQLVKYRYAIKDVSGQKIAVVAEIVKSVTITLN